MNKMASQLTGTELIARWLPTAVPELDLTQQRVAVEVTRMLSEGRPVAVEPLAGRLGLPPATVDDTFDRLRTVTRDDMGRATSGCGLTLAPTDYRLTGDNQRGPRLYTWCAWDTFIVAEVLGRNLRSHCRCPVTDEVISVHVQTDGVCVAEPATTMMCFPLVDISATEELGSTFCRFVKFLVSADACAHWTARHDVEIVSLSLEDAAGLARIVSLATFPAVFEQTS